MKIAFALPILGLAAGLVAAPALALPFKTLDGGKPIVIAHRGASGYLPEHTIEAYEYAARMGVDYIEPDVQITSDGHLVAMHDSSLDRTTNVETVLGKRNDGYKVSDYTLAEIRQLTVDLTPTKSAPGFSSAYGSGYKVPTLTEVLDFANQWNADKGAQVGVYPEAKAASSALNAQILTELEDAGFASTADDHVYIQSFSNAALREIDGLQAGAGTDIDMIALGYVVTGGMWYGTDGAADLADMVADGIDGLGVYIGSPGLADMDAWEAFIASSHDMGLSVVGWTFGKADDAEAAEQLAAFFDAGMDGVFANYPDQAIAAVETYGAAPVPAPAALGLLGAGLASLGVAGRRRRAA